MASPVEGGWKTMASGKAAISPMSPAHIMLAARFRWPAGMAVEAFFKTALAISSG